MEPRSWNFTVLLQVSLCLAFFLAVNMGNRRSKALQHSRNGGDEGDLDVYFISVRGGFRPVLEQTQLLKLIEKVARAYKVKFVINISELGDSDPLMRNATLMFQILRIPWYTTETSHRQAAEYFLKGIKISHGKELDIIGLDTTSIQDFMLKSSRSAIRSNQLSWLTRTLEASNSSWRIVVGFHPLSVCEEDMKQIKENNAYKPLHLILWRFGVNAYLSANNCSKEILGGSIAFRENPGSMIKEVQYSVARRQVISREMIHGFLLHRVGSLEIVTYFVNSSGYVVHKSRLHERGNQVM